MRRVPAIRYKILVNWMRATSRVASARINNVPPKKALRRQLPITLVSTSDHQLIERHARGPFSWTAYTIFRLPLEWTIIDAIAVKEPAVRLTLFRQYVPRSRRRPSVFPSPCSHLESSLVEPHAYDFISFTECGYSDESVFDSSFIQHESIQFGKSKKKFSR